MPPGPQGESVNNVFTRLDKNNRILTIVTVGMTCVCAVTAVFDKRFAWMCVLAVALACYVMGRIHEKEALRQLEVTLPSVPTEDA